MIDIYGFAIAVGNTQKTIPYKHFDNLGGREPIPGLSNNRIDFFFVQMIRMSNEWPCTRFG